MHTQRTIVLILFGVVAVFAGLVVAVIGVVGLRPGAVVVVATAVIVAAVYRWLLGPWHRRWGATDAEATGAMPGDDIVADRIAETTRAITVPAPPAEVWPWLVQLGFGRAGWYSYDWIDNDGQPSATTIRAELQHLDVGDVIAMTPTMGFTVRSVDPGSSIVSEAPDGTTWCLRVTPVGDGASRLVSRFRTRPVAGWAGRCWMLLADPGAFVMERKMLLGIARRAGDVAVAGRQAGDESRDARRSHL